MLLHAKIKNFTALLLQDSSKNYRHKNNNCCQLAPRTTMT